MTGYVAGVTSVNRVSAKEASNPPSIRLCLGRPDLGIRARQALRRASVDKLCTEELPRKDGRQLSTAEFGDYIVELLRQK